MTRRDILACLVALAMLALPATALAETSPVKVTADSFVVSEAENLATFSGNVVVTHPKVTVWAPKVIVHYAGGDTSNVTDIEATGPVRIKTKDQDATGDRASFDPKDQILKLSGNVVVTNSSGQLKGPLLVVNLKTNVSTFSSGGGGRVTGVFNAQ